MISFLTAIILNSIPLFGVMFFSWDLFTLLFAYVMEIAVLGIWMIIRILAAQQQISKDAPTWYSRWSAALFGFFWVTIFVIGMTLATVTATGSPSLEMNDIHNLLLTAGWFFIAHGMRLIKDVFLSGTYKQENPLHPFQMLYGRMATGIGVILLAGLLVPQQYEGVGMYAGIIVVKTVVDGYRGIVERGN